MASAAVLGPAADSVIDRSCLDLTSIFFAGIGGTETGGGDLRSAGWAGSGDPRPACGRLVGRGRETRAQRVFRPAPSA